MKTAEEKADSMEESRSINFVPYQKEKHAISRIYALEDGILRQN